MQLRQITRPDHDTVLALNQGALDGVGPLDGDRLEWILGLADQMLLADDDGTIAGFALTLMPGTEYDSANYRWFCERYEAFTYLDRIVIAPSHRRQGVGTAIYDAVEAAAAECHHPRVALEVNVEPPNVASLGFHTSRGYAEVGRLEQDDGKTVAMMVKSLT